MSTPSKSKTIALLSGGLDSTTAVAMALEQGEEIIGLSFDYGQRHKRELRAAKQLAKELNIKEHLLINVNLSKWGGSSLTDLQKKVPTKGVIKNKIPNTYVPGRNTVFIALALSLAEATRAQNVLLGINAMDYSGYPDCRPDYIDAFQKLTDLSSKAGREGYGPKLCTPLINWSKVEIIQEALRLKVPIHQTWSCYQGLLKPCGSCDSCRIRDEALKKVGRSDLCSRSI